MRRRTVVAVSLTLLVLGAIAFASCMSFVPNGAELSAAEVEDAMFDLVNSERVKSGLAVLARDNDLDALAKLYAAAEFSPGAEDYTALRYLLCNSWRLTYSTGTAKLREGIAEEQVEYCLSEPALRSALLREEARATGVGLCVVENTVYFSQIFDVLNAVDGDGDPVRLYENEQAQDLTWEDVKAFVEQDDTDRKSYIEGQYVCADFAMTLHNRAEMAGMRTAYVSVTFQDGPGHALNAFNTVDRGLVFIDCTGQQPSEGGITGWESSTQHSESYDKVAYIAVGRTYGVVGLDCASSFDYAFYEAWLEQWAEYEQKLKLYNEKRDMYETLLAGRKVIRDPEEYEALKAMLEEIDSLVSELGALEEELCGCYHHSEEPVTMYYVHW